MFSNGMRSCQDSGKSKVFSCFTNSVRDKSLSSSFWLSRFTSSVSWRLVTLRTPVKKTAWLYLKAGWLVVVSINAVRNHGVTIIETTRQKKSEGRRIYQLLVCMGEKKSFRDLCPIIIIYTVCLNNNNNKEDLSGFPHHNQWLTE